MKRIDWKKLTKRRVLGLGIMALGAIVTFAMEEITETPPVS